MADKVRPKQVSEMSDEELLGFKEQGAEEEATPFEMVKPIKQAAIANAGLKGSKTGNALDAMLPDSPGALLSQAGRGIKGIGKFMNAMPPKQGTSAAAKELSRFGNKETVQSAPGLVAYGKNTAPITNQIADETARTIDYSKLGNAVADEPMWKKKLREQGKLVIRKK